MFVFEIKLSLIGCWGLDKLTDWVESIDSFNIVRGCFGFRMNLNWSACYTRYLFLDLDSKRIRLSDNLITGQLISGDLSFLYTKLKCFNQICSSISNNHILSEIIKKQFVKG